MGPFADRAAAAHRHASRATLVSAGFSSGRGRRTWRPPDCRDQVTRNWSGVIDDLRPQLPLGPRWGPQSRIALRRQGSVSSTARAGRAHPSGPPRSAHRSSGPLSAARRTKSPSSPDTARRCTRARPATDNTAFAFAAPAALGRVRACSSSHGYARSTRWQQTSAGGCARHHAHASLVWARARHRPRMDTNPRTDKRMKATLGGGYLALASAGKNKRVASTGPRPAVQGSAPRGAGTCRRQPAVATVRARQGCGIVSPTHSWPTSSLPYCRCSGDRLLRSSSVGSGLPRGLCSAPGRSRRQHQRVFGTPIAVEIRVGVSPTPDATTQVFGLLPSQWREAAVGTRDVQMRAATTSGMR